MLIKRLSDLAEQGDTEVELGEGELLLGYGLDGPLTVNLNRHSGVFVYGLTGSGKTALLRNILLSNLGRENLNISAIDFSGQLVEGVADRLQNSIAWSRDSALDFLQGLADMCKSREEPLRSCEYVFIDEIDMLSKPYQQQDFIDALDTIQTQGRAIGVHLFVGAQRLDWLSESFLAGFGHRIVMGSVSSKNGSSLTWRSSSLREWTVESTTGAGDSALASHESSPLSLSTPSNQPDSAIKTGFPQPAERVTGLGCSCSLPALCARIFYNRTEVQKCNTLM